MTSATLAFPEEIWRTLTQAVDERAESAAILSARLVETKGRAVVLIRDVAWLPVASYNRREANGLAIPSSAYIPLLRHASDDGSIALFLHTHPGGRPKPSVRDLAVDAALASTFANRTRTGVYGSVILGDRSKNPSISGVIQLSDGSIARVTHARIVGRSLRMISAWSPEAPPQALAAETGAFDRQIRTFGAAGQAVISGLRVAVIGAGGTGSAVAEQLARLGVRDLLLVDDDVVNSSNVSRVYGSRSLDAGKAKVHVVGRHLSDIGLGTNVSTIEGRVTGEAVTRSLMDRDLVFGCTDDHAGRVVLSRLAYAMLIPVLDMGVSVVTDGARVQGLYGRVTFVSPGGPCLICRNRIDLTRAREEQLALGERQRLETEGYVQGLGEPNPSVVSYTTTVASLAVDEFLDRLFGYGTASRHTELLLFLHDWQLRTNDLEGMPGHYCTDRKFWGRGAEDPFLGQIWSQ